MEPRLVPINALIALVTGEGGWPAPFGDAGYDLHGLEARLNVESKRNVIVDSIVVNGGARVVILSECKSGQNLRATQMESYTLVKPTHVARQVGLPFRDPMLELLMVALEQHEARLRVAQAAIDLDIPMLLVGDQQVRLTRELTALPAFTVAVPGTPPPIIVLDDQSSDEELVGRLLPALIAATRRGKTKVIGVDDLLGEVIPWWGIYPADGARRTMCTRATDALRRALVDHFAGDFQMETRSNRPCGVIRVLRSPTEYRPRGVTQGWQRLQRQAERAIGRRRPQPAAPGQLSFEDLGLGTEPARDDR